MSQATRITDILVNTPEGDSGTLSHEAQYVFNYNPDSHRAPVRQISLTMPVRSASYNDGALLPIFQMNLPEGYLRRFIAERLMREKIRVNDMLLLAIQGQHGIGRLGFHTDLARSEATCDSLEEILHWQGKEPLFTQLAQRHLLNTTVSGVQPKLVVNQSVTLDEKRSLVRPELIVKTGGEEFPHLAFNEFVCMSAATALGLATPEFWLSDNEELFVCRRFDFDGEQPMGMEDFLTLMGKRETDQQTTPVRYQGSYESAHRVLSLYGCEPAQSEAFFDYVAVSCLLGNGDAHLKNFSLMYRHIDDRPWLSPVYDLVCTTIYSSPKEGTALKINKEKRFPDKAGLAHFGKSLGLPAQRTGQRLEELGEKLLDFLNRFERWEAWPELRVALNKHLDLALALKQGMVGYRASLDRDKKRKSDRWLRD